MGTAHRGLLTVRLGLTPAPVLTPFDRAGDVAPWVAIGIAVLAALVQFRAWRRHRRVQIMLEVNPEGSKSVSLLGSSREQASGSKPDESGGDTASSPQTGR